jgi:hypothetical protein
MANAAHVATMSVSGHRDRDDERVPAAARVVQKYLVEHDGEIAQRRIRRPEREHWSVRDREQEDVVIAASSR